MGRDRDHVAARKWFVAGRVQGVGFRYFVQEKATALGLRGFVRNLEDGRVEVYATGPEEKLNDLAAALHIGPHMADVRTVDEQEEAVKQFPRFFVR
jgi:acylphosphatase